MNILFTFFYFLHVRKCFSLKYPSSSMEDEYSFYIFYLLPWKTSVLFLFYYLPSRRTSVLFLFSVNPMLQRRSFSCFSSMGLISNSHRVERNTNFLIMKKRKPCRRPRPCGGCSCPACESIARQRQRICRAIARRLALDSCFTDARASWQKGAVEYYTCRLSL